MVRAADKTVDLRPLFRERDDHRPVALDTDSDQRSRGTDFRQPFFLTIPSSSSSTLDVIHPDRGPAIGHEIRLIDPSAVPSHAMGFTGDLQPMYASASHH